LDLDADGRLDLAAACASGAAVATLRSLLPAAPGTEPYGGGTPGCFGRHGLAAGGEPRVGNAGFALAATGAPPGALGLVLAGGAELLEGADLLGAGLLFHLDPSSPSILALDARGDAQGLGIARAPIPADPGLAGLSLRVQAFWLWPVCWTLPLSLSSSRALRLTILP
jgi:hypothetical protein